MSRISKPRSAITRDYWSEKIEAYNVAIEGLRMHEPMSDCDLKLAARLREKLALKLEREIQRWVDANPMPDATTKEQTP